MGFIYFIPSAIPTKRKEDAKMMTSTIRDAICVDWSELVGGLERIGAIGGPFIHMVRIEP
jgi:hypothetical protein